MAAIVHTRRDSGLITITELESGGETHTPTFTCSHCNNVIAIEARRSAADMGGWCFRCAAAICAACAGDPACVPFLRRLDEMERRDRLRRQALGDHT